MGVIDDIKINLGKAYTKLETKGATIPEYKNMENLEGTIDSVSVEKEAQQKTVNLSMASGNQVVTPDTNKVLSQVTIEKPATLIPANIKKDVTIGGVTGNLESGITPTGNINITNTNQTDVTNYATAQVVDANLVAGNIKNSVSILGVQGSYEGKPEQTKTVSLSLASGNQVVTPDENKTLSQVTITKPATLIPSYIRFGTTIAGVQGSYTGKPEQAKTAELSMASGNQVVTPDTGKTLLQVTITKPATLIPANIKKDVTIGGVVGTLEEGITPTGNINITNTNQTDVTNYATAQVVDANLVAENIKNNVSILGVQGSYAGIIPSGNQDIETLNEYDVSTKATARVSATERTKIIAGNIKNGVSILGVTGDYTGTPTQTKTVGLSMASGNQVVTPDTNKVLSQVTIEKPATLIPANIKKDVTIGGVTGNLESGITPTGNINITNTNQTDVTNYATAQVVDANLVAGNIKNGVSILGVTGTVLETTITVNQDNSIDLTIA